MNKLFIRFISYVTMCLMLINAAVIPSANAAENDLSADNMTPQLKRVIDVLRYFEFIPDYYDYNTNPAETASRADFAVAAAKLVKQTTYSGGDTYYYDVPQTYWAYNEICALTQAGVLNGSGDKLFRPNDKIKKAEAYKILLTIMGYKLYAESDGGYPNGYLNRAYNIELNENVSSSELVTLSDMFEMLYNAMKINVMQITGGSGGSVEFSVSDKDTLMSVYYNVYYGRGTVTGAEYITTDGNTLAQKDDVKIDDEVYKSDVALFENFGEEIEFFYFSDSDGDDKRILWAASMGKTTSINIVADNDALFDKTDFKLTYHDNNKKRNIRLSHGITVIYNGGVVSEEIDKIFNLPRYEAKIVQNKNGEYAIAIVKSYENIVVDKIDSENMIVYDKNNPNKSVLFDENKYDKLTVKMHGQTEMTFSDIKTEDVLSVYKSLDGRYMEVYVNAEQITGIIQSIQPEENGNVIVIDSIEYFMPQESAVSNYKVGDNVSVYLDVKGEIAYLQKISGNEFAAYLIKAFKESYEDYFTVKLFDENGNMRYVKSAQKTKIDGNTYKDADTALKALNGIPTLAIIKTDTDGAIREIDTPNFNKDYENEDSLSVNIERGKNLLFRDMGNLGRHSMLNSQTKIFVIPDESSVQTAEDTDFAIINYKQISNDTTVDAETYKTKQRVGYEQYVLLRNYSRIDYTAELPVVVEGISSTVNKDNAVVECINGFQGNNKVSLEASEEFSFSQKGVSKGMVISLRRDNAGEINDCVIIYDYNNKEEYTNVGGDNSNYAFRMGYVTDMVDGVIKIGTTPGAFDIANYTSNVPVIVVNTHKTKNNIHIGTINEAATYYNVGDECSSVVMFTRWTGPRMFIIYN